MLVTGKDPIFGVHMHVGVVLLLDCDLGCC